jgi:spore maturation protein CgeB
MYEIGKEIETFKCADELIDKVQELSGQPAKRKQLRQGGQRRALTEHSVPNTLRKIFKTISNR